MYSYLKFCPEQVRISSNSVTDKQQDSFSQMRDGKVMTHRGTKDVPYVYQVHFRCNVSLTYRHYASLHPLVTSIPVRSVTSRSVDNLIVPTNRWQGDTKMYTTENLEKRKRLFFHPEIGKAIRAFWNVLDLTKDAFGCIGMSDYMVMNIKMQKALMPGLRINVRGTITSNPTIHHQHHHQSTSS